MTDKTPYTTPEIVSLGDALDLTESNQTDNLAEVAGGPWRRGAGDDDSTPDEE